MVRLTALIEPHTGGDPMTERKWLRKSLRHLHQQLGKAVSHTTIGRLLRDLDYSLKANLKRLTGDPHPDRDQQFAYIERQKQRFVQAGWPIISVDTKKKELIGNFKNAGQQWCREAEQVNEHDFAHDAQGKAVPYGIYNLNHNRGWVYVGTSADTAQFAVDAIAAWWQSEGSQRFPNAPKLLILCDAGGSNGYRSRLWKVQLQTQLADHLGVEVTVCHYPRGASKWNPVEHRLFGPISVNWAGVPLRSFATLLALIRGTTNQSGLQVEAVLMDKVYKKGLKVGDEVMADLNIERHPTCPNWNYTIRPHPLGTLCP
jgi:hypothetical protein